MIDRRKNCYIYDELDNNILNELFSKNDNKFLSTIDTFYYSIKLNNDFTVNSIDKNVSKFRNTFNHLKLQLDNYNNDCYTFNFGKHSLNLTNLTFANIYSIHLEYPEYFDIFIAPVVPKSATSDLSVTSEILVQIRSYLLWQLGPVKAFEFTFDIVKDFIAYFNLSISSVIENRVDYCWHTNYFKNPEKFFTPENIDKMQVSHFKGANLHMSFKGSQGHEIDYISFGKRSDKVFIRCYLKSKEVVEKGYKGWFFKIWQLNGLISRYDFFVYDLCYKERSWAYQYKARLLFYLEYGTNEKAKADILALLKDSNIKGYDKELIKLADTLTPAITLIMNIEYEVKRRHSKSYELLEVKDNTKYGVCKRIYDYFDNRKLIIDYLTSKVFKLVDKSKDEKVSRCPYVKFWELLRSAKHCDIKVLNKGLKLVRKYNRQSTGEMLLKRISSGLVSLSVMKNGINNNSLLTDAMDFINMLNDNDIQKAKTIKHKKISRLNLSEPTNFHRKSIRNLVFLDEYTGELVDDYSAF